jgi:U3 small nucleolar RNA-associated protein 13
MEGSEDKLWALDCSPDGQLVVTGSADSVLTIWKDVTDQKVVESLNRRKENLENDQKLSNVVRNGDWAQAIRLAIELDRPFTLLKVIRGKGSGFHVLTLQAHQYCCFLAALYGLWLSSRLAFIH